MTFCRTFSGVFMVEKIVYKDILIIQTFGLDIQGGKVMSGIIGRLLQRASMCPVACSLKFLFLICCLSTLYIAIYHRLDVAPYLYTVLVGLIGLVASFALAFHWNCQLRDSGKND